VTRRTALTVRELLTVTDAAATFLDSIHSGSATAPTRYALDQHAAALRSIAQLCQTAIDTSHMGTAADTVILELGDDDLFEAIAEHLKEHGITATYEYPGWLAIAEGDELGWAIGHANETWSGELTDVAGEPVETAAGDGEIEAFTTTVPRDCRDAAQIADAIWQAINYWRAERAVR
jgi:hypothetical protein